MVRLLLCEGMFENADVFGVFFALLIFPVFGPGL